MYTQPCQAAGWQVSGVADDRRGKRGGNWVNLSALVLAGPSTSARCIQTANWHVKFKMYGFLTALWRKTADFYKRKHVSPKPASGECDEASSWSWVHCQCSCSLIFTLLRLIKTVFFYSSGEKSWFFWSLVKYWHSGNEPKMIRYFPIWFRLFVSVWLNATADMLGELISKNCSLCLWRFLFEMRWSCSDGKSFKSAQPQHAV